MKSGPSQFRSWWPPEAWAAFLGGAGATAAALAAAGVSLGLAIGGFVAGAILLPPLAASSRDWHGRAGVVIACMAGIGAVWLSFIGRTHATMGQWFELVALLGAFLIGLVGIIVGLAAAGLPKIPAAAAAVFLAIGWITWPVWLSPAALGVWLQWLIEIQPALAANGLLKFTLPWTEQAIAYRLTTLDQDVPIALPVGVWAGIAFHAGIGLGIAAILVLKQRYTAKGRPPAE